jgi:hypothetical protein
MNPFVIRGFQPAHADDVVKGNRRPPNSGVGLGGEMQMGFKFAFVKA